MSELGFPDRLAYLRWLRNLGRVVPEKDGELAKAWGVGLQWLRKWKRRPEAPEGRTEATAIGKALEPMGTTVEWLYDGAGAAPRPDLWREWLVARALAAEDQSAAAEFLTKERTASRPATARGAAAKAAGAGKGRSPRR